MTDLTTVPAGTYGLDWVAAWPDPIQMRARGALFAAIYLKAWNDKWVASALAAGVAVVAIGEVGETTDSGGARAGETNARHWVDLAHQHHVPAGCPIILTHDTSSWFGQVSVDYYTAGAHVLRDNGYRLGGYGGRKLFGNTPELDWDLIWAWSAIGADPAPDNPHVQQGTHHTIRRGDNRRMWTGVDFVIDGLVKNLDSIDTNVSRRAFTAWGATTAAPPAAEQTAPTPITITPAPTQGVDMSIGILELSDAKAILVGECTPAGGMLRVVWIDGADPDQLAALDLHIANSQTVYVCRGGTSTTRLPEDDPRRWDSSICHGLFVNKIPTGDALKQWRPAGDFAGIA